MNSYSTLPKTPALVEPHHQICLVSYQGHSLGESYPSLEMQSRGPAESNIQERLIMRERERESKEAMLSKQLDDWIGTVAKKMNTFVSTTVLLELEMIGRKSLTGTMQRCRVLF